MTTTTLASGPSPAPGRPGNRTQTGTQTATRGRPDHGTPTSTGTRPGAVTAVVCLALATVVAAMSSLNVALPEIARATHATQTQLAWIIDAYSLVFASLLLPAGAIGDRYGRRLALIAGLATFGGASAVAMTAHSAAELIGLRAVMGLGAALVMPATLSTITGTFADEQRARAVSVWAAVAGGAAVLGLLVSGLARMVCVTGLTLIAAAMIILAQLTPASGYWLLVVGLIPLGAGMGLATTPATSGITFALPAARQGVGSALNDLSRELGGAIGIAVLASLLTGAYQTHLHLPQATHLTAAQAGLARSSVAVATHLGGAVAAQAQSAFADGMHLALYVAAGIVTAAALGVATLLRGRGDQAR
jgi:MFS family permease